MLIRHVILCAVVGLLIGGASGVGLSTVFILSPMVDVLGPRYAEFDALAAIIAAGLAAVIAGVFAIPVAIWNLARPRSAFRRLIIYAFILVPAAIYAVLTFTVKGDWAWYGIMYVSACLGILAASRTAMFLERRSRDQKD
jgi:hypothetical protein